MINFVVETLPRASPEIKWWLTLDLDLVNDKGQTADLCAVRRGASTMLTALLQAGAGPNIPDALIITCLQMVCLRIDPNSPNDYSHTSASSSPSHALSPSHSAPIVNKSPLLITDCLLYTSRCV